MKRSPAEWVKPILDVCRYLSKAGVVRVEWLTLDPTRHIQVELERLIFGVLDRRFVAGFDYMKAFSRLKKGGLATCLRQEFLGAIEPRVL